MGNLMFMQGTYCLDQSSRHGAVGMVFQQEED